MLNYAVAFKGGPDLGLCIAMTRGEIIRAARTRAGWGQKRLADEVGDGCDQSRISKIETGELTGEPHLARIAEVLDVPLGELQDAPVREDGAEERPRVRAPSSSYDGHVRGTSLPIIGTVTAGFGAVWAEEEAASYRLDPGVCLVRVTGRSGGSIIRDQQYAVLAPEERKPRNGDIVAVQTKDGQTFVKRLSVDARHGRLILTNIDPSADGDAVTLDQDEVGRARVVIGCIYE